MDRDLLEGTYCGAGAHSGNTIGAAAAKLKACFAEREGTSVLTDEYALAIASVLKKLHDRRPHHVPGQVGSIST